jgi:diaminopimelate decarboxylase
MHSGLDHDSLVHHGRDERRGAIASRHWWERPDLAFRDGSLSLGGRDLYELASTLGTPLYVYSRGRVREKLERIHAALEAERIRHRIFYAMKANRYEPLLQHIQSLGLCGADVCSPGEMALATQTGFSEEEISYTGTSVSNADLDAIARHPDVWINCDSLSSLRRLGERCPGRRVGLRINPGLGIGYGVNELLRYSGSKPTKFGIYESQMDEALQIARRFDLSIVGLHVHAGCGYLSPQLAVFDAILDAIGRFSERVGDIDYVNIGGGLGSPLVAADPELDLAQWARSIASRLGHLDAEIWVEPGDFIVKDAGVLLLQVNTVEQKEGVCFIGVDGGFNIHIEPAFYALPMEVVPCRSAALSDESLQRVTVAGNINEALDLWAQDILLPRVAEGDYLALLNGGAYGSSMSSNHCMRGAFSEYLVP